jgi:hypothetical protein
VKTPRRVCRIDEAVVDYSALTGDIHTHLAMLLDGATPTGEEPADRFLELVQECALLAAMAAGGEADRVLLSFRTLGHGRAIPDELRSAYMNVFSKQNGFVATPLDDGGVDCASVIVEMPGAASIFAGEAGTQVVYAPGGGVTPVQVAATVLHPEVDPMTVTCDRTAAREHWHDRVAAGESAADSDPDPLGPVVRVCDPAVATLDLRTGLICPNRATGEDLRRFILSALRTPDPLSPPTA